MPAEMIFVTAQLNSIMEDKPDNVKHNHENTFVNMFNNLGEKIKNLQEKIDTEVKKTQASKNILEESLNLNLHWYLNCQF